MMSQHYIRLKTLELKQVLPLIGSGSKATFDGLSVNVSSLRLKTFAKRGTTCSCCKLEASFFAIEKQKNNSKESGNGHLNLWGVKDGEEVLFTHDHTLARGLGGKNDISNTTTMCTDCNYLKSLAETEEYLKRKAEK